MDLTAIIIDDEAPSVRAVEKVISEFCPGVKIVGKTQSPIEGIELVNTLNPDVVFLDIEMPVMNGFEFLESIPKPDFNVVFITAYNHYAVQAFRVNAIDYILKPVKIKDIIQAINKVVERKKSKVFFTEKYKNVLLELSNQYEKKINISTSGGVMCFKISEIIRFEADGRYSNLYLTNEKKLCFSKTLKEIQGEINQPCFLRIHKSHLINMNYVRKYNLTSAYNVELIDGSVLDISRRKKEEFIKYMINTAGN